MKTEHLFMALITLLCYQYQAYGDGAVRNYSWMQIKSANNECLQAEGNQAHFMECSDDNAQRWFYTPLDELRFRNADGELSSTCLDLPTESKGVRLSALQLYPCGAHESSRWPIIMAQFYGPAVRVKLFSRWAGEKNQCIVPLNDGTSGIDNCDEAALAFLTIIPDDETQGVFDVLPEAALVINDIKKHTWMENLYKFNANVKLSSIIIPGTHNSATYDFSTISRTQSQPILTQLYDGIRYFDIRTDVRKKWFSSELVITHGKENGANGSVESVFQQIKEFSDSHPKEVIVLDLHEIPKKLKEGLDPEGEKNIKTLARALDILKDNLVLSKHSNKLTLQKIWHDQRVHNHHRNIVLIVRNSAHFYYSFERDLFAYMTDRKGNMLEEWPESTDFNVIYSKNTTDLTDRNSTTESAIEWHCSQLIRTPSWPYFVSTTLLGWTDGPQQLCVEKTNDGYFNNMVAPWLNEWVNKMHLSPNLLMTDFYEQTRLVPMSIWLNLQIRNNQP